MAYGKSKYLAKITQSDKTLRDKAFKMAKDPKYDGYQRGLASMVYRFFDTKSSEVMLTLNQITNSRMNFINRLLENLKEDGSIHPSKIISGVLI